MMLGNVSVFEHVVYSLCEVHCPLCISAEQEMAYGQSYNKELHKGE